MALHVNYIHKYLATLASNVDHMLLIDYVVICHNLYKQPYKYLINNHKAPVLSVSSYEIMHILYTILFCFTVHVLR